MRSLWKGALSFGLVHIPVRLYSASRGRELKFKLLHNKDLGEIHYARLCSIDGKEIPWDEIVKGYETDEGKYAILTEQDFEKVNLKKTQSIEILSFAEEGAIDPFYYDTPYYLEPEKGSAKAYALLREALKKSRKVAIGNYVLRHHERLGVIKAVGDVLILNQLRYEAEMISPKELNIPKKQPVDKKELDVALKLIDQLTMPFNPKDYKDTYIQEVKAMIKKKTKSGNTKFPKVEKSPSSKSQKVHDIMSLLKQSLQKKDKKRKSA